MAATATELGVEYDRRREERRRQALLMQFKPGRWCNPWSRDKGQAPRRRESGADEHPVPELKPGEVFGRDRRLRRLSY